jgi:hypothetical protein
MIAGFVFMQKSVDDLVWSGGAIQNCASERILILGMSLLAISSVGVAIGAIYGSRRLVLVSAARTGTVCLAIAAAFWRAISLEGRMNTHGWILALMVPEFVWAAAGVVLLLVSGLRFVLEKSRS